MSREIKFRTWDRENKEFAEWTNRDPFFSTSYGKIFFWEKTRKEDGSYGGDVVLEDSENRFVLQQFTGLLDKNGKEIFEGDILKTEDETLLVDYCEEYAKFGAIIYIQDGREPENTVWYWGEDLFHTYGEIVGNIFENQELLA